MKKVLITGATGNVGKPLIRYLLNYPELEVCAAIRTPEKSKSIFNSSSNLSFCAFDFENPETFKSALKEVDILFLLRPPHISDVQKYFKPLLAAARSSNIQKIVFLSVQGAEKHKVIPHNKIERLIKSSGFDYLFVRPSYFMQNLTTTLLPELLSKNRITLPAGDAHFNWIDADNIGEAIARLIINFDRYKNSAIELTGQENMSFNDALTTINEVTNKSYQFRNINPISFYFEKRRDGLSNGLALVMTALHFLPRLQDPPKKNDNFQHLTGNQPTTLKEFIIRNKNLFMKG